MKGPLPLDALVKGAGLLGSDRAAALALQMAGGEVARASRTGVRGAVRKVMAAAYSSVASETHDLTAADTTASLDDFAVLHARLRQGVEKATGSPSLVKTLVVGFSEHDAVQAAPGFMRRLASARRHDRFGAAMYIAGRIFLSDGDRDIIEAGLGPDGPADPFELWSALKRSLHEHIHGALDHDGSDFDPGWEQAWVEGLTELASQVYAQEVYARAGLFERQPLLRRCVEPPSYPQFTSAIAITVSIAAQLQHRSPRDQLDAMMATGSYKKAFALLRDDLASVVPAKARTEAGAAIGEAIVNGLAPLAAAYYGPQPPQPASVEPGAIRAEFQAASEAGIAIAQGMFGALVAAHPWVSLEFDAQTIATLYAGFYPGRDVDSVTSRNQPNLFLSTFENGYTVVVDRATRALHPENVTKVLKKIERLPTAQEPARLTIAEASERVKVSLTRGSAKRAAVVKHTAALDA